MGGSVGALALAVALAVSKESLEELRGILAEIWQGCESEAEMGLVLTRSQLFMTDRQRRWFEQAALQIQSGKDDG